MDKDSIMQALREADMVLVGLGEEFDGTSYLGQDPSYQQGRQWLEKEQEGWMVPAWMEYCLDKTGREALEEAVGKLTHILEGHNYFVISVSTNRTVALAPWREGRFVAPCGTTLGKQCRKDCTQAPVRSVGSLMYQTRSMGSAMTSGGIWRTGDGIQNGYREL